MVSRSVDPVRLWRASRRRPGSGSRRYFRRCGSAVLPDASRHFQAAFFTSESVSRSTSSAMRVTAFRLRSSASDCRAPLRNSGFGLESAPMIESSASLPRPWRRRKADSRTAASSSRANRSFARRRADVDFRGVRSSRQARRMRWSGLDRPSMRRGSAAFPAFSRAFRAGSRSSRKSAPSCSIRPWILASSGESSWTPNARQKRAAARRIRDTSARLILLYLTPADEGE